MLSIACSNEEKVTVTANPTSTAGRPARFDGPLDVTVQSGDGTVEAPTAASPNTFKCVSGDIAGQTVYLVEGDVDLGAGVVKLSETVELTVTGAAAANFGLAGGAVEPKAAA
jgi:hypothetical protein